MTYTSTNRNIRKGIKDIVSRGPVRVTVWKQFNDGSKCRYCQHGQEVHNFLISVVGYHTMDLVHMFCRQCSEELGASQVVCYNYPKPIGTGMYGSE